MTIWNKLYEEVVSPPSVNCPQNKLNKLCTWLFPGLCKSARLRGPIE